MAAVGDRLRRARVGAVYLVHGTFFGSDSLGLLANLSWLAPGLADVLRGWNKQLVDTVAGDFGNFTRDYAEAFAAAINPPGAPPIPVRLFLWSSENHHLGRADGAVRLLHELLEQQFPDDQRVLLVCHSHGGNVAALLTNLLVSDREARQEFFQAARYFYRGPFGRVDAPIWEVIEEKARRPDTPWPPVCLDVVTLGTPVRYGWDIAACDQLLHVINHRPFPGLAPSQAIFPPTRDDLWFGRSGDFIQQIGIAGTNFVPPLWALRACHAERRLARLLQLHESPADLLTRLRLGVRAHEDGQNILVDYGAPEGNPAQHLFGHAIYTRKEWMLFHAELIAQQMYGLHDLLRA